MSEKIFHINNTSSFIEVALEVFRHQATRVDAYRKYVELLGIDPYAVQSLEDIPYMPIEFFKTFDIQSSRFSPEVVFTSSGTTGQQTSKHLVRSLNWYQQTFTLAFEQVYGPMSSYAVLGLLPAYLERSGSSLVYMVNHMIEVSEHQESGFFLNDHQMLLETLRQLRDKNTPTLLIGVTFGLLDFVEHFSIDFPNLIVMETGGMKGRRREMIREEVHGLLAPAFGVEKIHSEYGMTELMSQAYSTGDGLFKCPAWMKVLRRDVADPFHIQQTVGSGALNIIDLANVDSCCFIATQDLVRLHENGRFEVLGRFDHAEARGCNLMVV